jgi:hypothetical protein
MYICIISAFVLSCVGSGFAIGLSTVREIQIDSEWEQAKGPNPSKEEEVLVYLVFV